MDGIIVKCFRNDMEKEEATFNDYAQEWQLEVEKQLLWRCSSLGKF